MNPIPAKQMEISQVCHETISDYAAQIATHQTVIIEKPLETFIEYKISSLNYKSSFGL